MLASYMVDVLGLDIDLDLHTLFTVLPNDSGDPVRGRPAFALGGRVPLILSSHHPCSPHFDHANVVLLVRGPKDVLVSRWMHLRHQRGIYHGSLSQFVAETTGELVNYLNGWAARVGGVHLVSYEVLHREGAAALLGVAAFVGLPSDAGSAQRAVTAGAFDRMQRIERETGLAGPNTSDDPRGARVRRGQVGGYRDELTSEDEAVVEVALRRLSPEAAALLHQLG